MYAGRVCISENAITTGTHGQCRGMCEHKRDQERQKDSGTENMAPVPSMQLRKGARGDSTWNLIQTGYVECWETQLSPKTETEQISLTHHVLKIPKSSPGPQLTFHVPETGAQVFSRPNIPAFFNSPLHDNSPFWCPSPNIQVTNVPLNVLGQNQTPRNNSKPALPAWSADTSAAGSIWTLSFH